MHYYVHNIAHFGQVIVFENKKLLCLKKSYDL